MPPLPPGGGARARWRFGGVRIDAACGRQRRRAQLPQPSNSRLCRLDRAGHATHRFHWHRLLPAARRPYPDGHDRRQARRPRPLGCGIHRIGHDTRPDPADGLGELGSFREIVRLERTALEPRFQPRHPPAALARQAARSLAFAVLGLRLSIQLCGYARAFLSGSARPVAVPLNEDASTVAAREAESVSGLDDAACNGG